MAYKKQEKSNHAKHDFKVPFRGFRGKMSEGDLGAIRSQGI
jgi:hypothetical protein